MNCKPIEYDAIPHGKRWTEKVVSFLDLPYFLAGKRPAVRSCCVALVRAVGNVALDSRRSYTAWNESNPYRDGVALMKWCVLMPKPFGLSLGGWAVRRTPPARMQFVPPDLALDYVSQGVLRNDFLDR